MSWALAGELPGDGKRAVEVAGLRRVLLDTALRSGHVPPGLEQGSHSVHSFGTLGIAPMESHQ
jgi:hypothetical protein